MSFFKRLFSNPEKNQQAQEVMGKEPQPAQPETARPAEEQPADPAEPAAAEFLNEDKTLPNATPPLGATAPLSATSPLSPDLLLEESFSVSPPQMVVGVGHSVGLMREHNEDAIFTFSTCMVTDSRQIPFGLFVVADGMGGHQHGEIASGIAVRAMATSILRKAFLPMVSVEGSMPDESLQEILQNAVSEAHANIVKDAIGGGTTLTTALVFGEQLMIAHVGDSRAYAVYQDGTLRALTRDHSLVRRLEELGQITSAEAAIHPQRNVLYRALGQGEPADPDIASYPLPKGGYLMLCSDGLWGLVSEKELGTIIREAQTLEVACQKMVASANNHGGPDNISVVLVRIPR